MNVLPLVATGAPASAASDDPLCRCEGSAGGSAVGGLLCLLLGGFPGLGGGGRFGGTLESSVFFDTASTAGFAAVSCSASCIC